MQLKKVRRKSRIYSLQILYCSESSNIDLNSILSGEHTIPDLAEIDEYTQCLVEGVYKNLRKIDKEIDSVSKNWAIERMPICDKCLLRQTIYEMFYIDDVPVSVSINEAVEIAKLFGGENDSPKFINGILGKISKEHDLN